MLSRLSLAILSRRGWPAAQASSAFSHSSFCCEGRVSIRWAGEGSSLIARSSSTTARIYSVTSLPAAAARCRSFASFSGERGTLSILEHLWTLHYQHSRPDAESHRHLASAAVYASR